MWRGRVVIEVNDEDTTREEIEAFVSNIESGEVWFECVIRIEEEIEDGKA